MNVLKRTWCAIDLDRLQYNINILKREAKKELFAVVKANAYGHGDRVLAPKLQELGIDHFAVSNLNEAITLRRVGIAGEILILGYTPVSMADALAEYDIVQTVFSEEYGKALQQAAAALGRVLRVHLKLDTGMGRIGFNVKRDDLALPELLSVCALDHLSVEGVFSHYSCADSFAEEDQSYSEEQTAWFGKTVRALQDAGVSFREVHLQNSAGILNLPDIDAGFARMGIAMYGLKPSADVKAAGEELLPLLSWKTTVELVKEIAPGDAVNYGRTFIADRPMTVASLTVGYADGYLRAFSNKADVLIHGRRCRVLGRVCMDQMVVDVTGLPVKMGDEVTLLGTDGSETITADELAALADTINYEIVCGISRRVPRLYYENGKRVAAEDDSIYFR